jgi:penicillin G amidase
VGRFIRWALGGAMLLIVIAGGSGTLWLYSSLPVRSGTLMLPGLEHPVRVARDRYGIPTITAASEHDADFALGFLHAQDRLFSMDMMRHYGAGRLSEIFGARTLGIDRALRTFGLYRAAEAQYANLSAPVRAALDAYAAGVNAFLATRKGALPPEYYLLDFKPEPWRPADSLVWLKLMDLELTGNFRRALARARLLKQLSPAELRVLYPSYPKDGPVALDSARAALLRLPLEKLMAALPPGTGPQAESNDWVVSGAHTKSGKPLLADDPHLDFAAPGVWYLARIRVPGLDLAGATSPGNPFVIIGHNDDIAWGFTTTGGDVEDLFIERPVANDPARYETPDGPALFVTRTERILVRDGTPETITVRATRHGPVISDLAGYRLGDDLLALETTWLSPDDRTPQALWELNRAHDWASFRDALKNVVAPQQNIVYADRAGNIGFMAPARLPIRKSGHAWLPVPGWNGDYDWTGWVPFDGLPSAFNPPSGRIFTANDKIVPDDYPYFITRDWELPYRAERIGALLDAHATQSPDASAAIQADDVSLPARILLPFLLQAKPQDPEAQALLAKLRQWHGRMDRDRAEPLIFAAWERELMRVLFEPKLGPFFGNYWLPHPDVVQSILTQHQDWCPNSDCNAAIALAFDRALDDLRNRYGKDSAQWRWGMAHEANFRSAFWSNVPLAKRWFDLAVGADGDNDTVDAGGMYFGDAEDPFLDVHGPGLRMIVDFAAPEAARFVIAPGESGNPLSPHWGDLVRTWQSHAYVTFDNDESGGVLRLVPP